MFTIYYFVPPCIVQRGGTLPNEGSNGKVDLVHFSVGPFKYAHYVLNNRNGRDC